MNRILIIAALTALSLVVGCREAEKEPAAQLPDNDEIVSIFIDLHMAEIPMARVPLSMRDSIGQVVRERIARDHEMDIEELDRIVHEVQLDFELSSEIYDSVEVRLDRMHRKGIFDNE